MVYLFVGAGEAGSSIVDELFRRDRIGKIAAPLVFNSTNRDLSRLSNVGEENQWGVPQRGTELIPATRSGFEQEVTGGFGKQPREAEKAIESVDDSEIERAFEHAFSDDGDGGEEVNFAVVCLGLGGGTGCGIAPALIDRIEDRFDTQVLVVGVLPNTYDLETDDIVGGSSDGGQGEAAGRGKECWNVMYGLNRLESRADGILLVDNQRLSYEDAMGNRFTAYNQYVADALADIVLGHVIERRLDPSESDVTRPTLDTRDLMTGIQQGRHGGTAGYASIGRSVTTTRTLAGYFVPGAGWKDVEESTMIRLATRKQTLASVDTEKANGALCKVRCQDRYLEEGEPRIQSSNIREFLTSLAPHTDLGSVRTNRNLASFTSVLSFTGSDIERLDEIERYARTYERGASA